MKARKPGKLVAALCLAAAAPMAAAQNQDFFQGESLSDLQRFRAYPHVDRGLQEYDKKHYRAAAEAFARALELAPASVRIRLALARAYIADNRLAEAEGQLQPLAERVAEADAMLFNLRSQRLEQDPPPSTKALVGWVNECVPEWCERYATLGATYLANKKNAAAARDVLEAFRTRRGFQSHSRPVLLLEASIAEGLHEWTAARQAFQGAAAISPLSAADNYRYGYALLGEGNFDGARHLLDEPWGKSPEGQRLAREVIQRAIAANRPNVALEQFARLDGQGALAGKDKAQWLRLLQAKGQKAEAARLMAELEKSRCPEGGQCAATPDSIGELEWLFMAGETGRTDVLEKTRPESEDGQRLRLRLLAERYQKEGQYHRLIQLLGPSAPDRPLTLTLVQAHERSGDRLGAAAQLEHSFRRWQHWEDLDRASYLLLTAGAPEKAKRLLQSALPFPQGRLGTALNQRLLDMYQEAPKQAEDQYLETLGRQKLTALQVETLADVWRLKGQCERSIALLENGQAVGRGLLVLADCYRPTQPGLAIQYYERAAAFAPELANRALAYLYQETGNPAAAVARWRSLPPASLNRKERLAAAEAALAANDLAQARRWWQEAVPMDAPWHRVGAQLEEKSGHQLEALDHWSAAHRLSPSGTSAYNMGRLQAAMGLKQESLASYREAFQRAPEEDEIRLSLSYALVDSSPLEAADLMEQSKRKGPERFPIEEQLAYLRARLGQNDEARRHLVAAIDEADQYLAQVPPDEAADRLYALRRTKEGLERRWAFGFNTWVASGGVPGELAAGRPLADGTPKHYAELTGEYRLGKQPVDNQRFLALTGRISNQGNSGDPYLQGNGLVGVGLRWKPLTDWNLYLAAEEQFPLNGRGRNDLMLRVSASFLDQGLYRGDWHPSGKSWLQQELYVDGAHWVDTGRYDVLARYTIGHNTKLATQMASSIFPYAFIQGERRTDGEDSRWGVGVAWRLWRDDDRYSAYRQTYAVKLERQQVIHSDIARSDGWFLKLEASW